MTDICTRLRKWAIATDAVPASDLMEEAAAEIEYLRQQAAQKIAEPASSCAVRRQGRNGTAGGGEMASQPTLTDAEREAIRFCIRGALPETEKLGGVAGELCRMHRDRLRGLLERLGRER